jgi:CRP-like cAMP-binding protein
MSVKSNELHAVLNPLASPIRVLAGQYLFHCGDPVSGVFLIRSGAVLMDLDSASHAFPPRMLGPGEIAGLPATLTGTYSLSALVAEDAELGFLPAQRVSELLETSPRICLLAMTMISEEVARMRSALKELPLNTATIH